MKPALEFFPTASVDWVEVTPGVAERVLARDGEWVSEEGCEMFEVRHAPVR